MPLTEILPGFEKDYRVVKRVRLGANVTKEEFTSDAYNSERAELAMKNCPRGEIYGFWFSRLKESLIPDPQEGADVPSLTGIIAYASRRRH